MKILLTLLILGLAAAWAASAQAEGKSAPERSPRKEFVPIEDIPGLPRVLLIGDSISIGYTLPTRAILKGKANVHRVPDNAGPTIKTLEHLDKWLGDGKWDVIHFNCGLHDLKLMNGEHQVPIDQYEKNLRKLVKRLQKTKAQLIWASTTPVPKGDVNPPRSPADVKAYNAIAKKIMDRTKIPINDLYAFAMPILNEIQRPANVHFTDEGSKRLAEQVAKTIEKTRTKKEGS